MKTKFIVFFLVISLVITGCSLTESTNEKGEKTSEFKMGETAKVNNTKMVINSVTKIDKECAFEWGGKCESYTEPENDYFLLIDLTVENIGSETLSISSLISFDLKDSNGEKGSLSYMLDAVKSSLDGDVMAGDRLKGQIAFDVKDSDVYYFYYSDSLIDSPIKFVINKDDIK